MKNSFLFIRSFILSLFLLVISLAGSVRAQELRGFMYLYGEMGGDYFSDEKLINFRIGQIDLLSSLAARNLFNKHFEYSAGLRIGISPEFAVKIGFSFFDMKKVEDRYFISLSAGWGIPIFEK